MAAKCRECGMDILPTVGCVTVEITIPGYSEHAEFCMVLCAAQYF